MSGFPQRSREMIRRFEETRRQVPTPDPSGGQSSSVSVYQATAAPTGTPPTVTVKAVKADGTLDATVVTLKTITGIDVAKNDFCIAVMTADGKRAAYPKTGAIPWAKFDGSRTTLRYTGHLWTGSQGVAIQWIFSPNDPGVDSLLGANEFCEVYPAPAWIASNAAYGAVGTYGEKYVGRLPLWAALA